MDQRRRPVRNTVVLVLLGQITLSSVPRADEAAGSDHIHPSVRCDLVHLGHEVLQLAGYWGGDTLAARRRVCSMLHYTQNTQQTHSPNLAPSTLHRSCSALFEKQRLCPNQMRVARLVVSVRAACQSIYANSLCLSSTSPVSLCDFGTRSPRLHPEEGSRTHDNEEANEPRVAES